MRSFFEMIGDWMNTVYKKVTFIWCLRLSVELIVVYLIVSFISDSYATFSDTVWDTLKAYGVLVLFEFGLKFKNAIFALITYKIYLKKALSDEVLKLFKQYEYPNPSIYFGDETDYLENVGRDELVSEDGRRQAFKLVDVIYTHTNAQNLTATWIHTNCVKDAMDRYEKELVGV